MRVDEIGWNGAWTRAFEATAGGQSFHAPVLLIGMAQGEPHDVAFRFDGGRTHAMRLLPGDVQVVPAGLPHDVEWPDCRFTLIGVEPGLVAEARSEGWVDPWSGEPRLRLRDPLVEALVQTLSREARDYAATRGPWRELYRDTLLRALLAQLSSGRPVLAGAPPGGRRQRLGTERVRRVVEWIDAHLDQAIELSGLAAVSGLSAFHFARIFKATMGVTPARYVAARRMQRAIDLLAEKRHDHETIARQCGFGDAAHLRRALRRRLHAVPLAALD